MVVGDAHNIETGLFEDIRESGRHAKGKTLGAVWTTLAARPIIFERGLEIAKGDISVLEQLADARKKVATAVGRQPSAILGPTPTHVHIAYGSQDDVGPGPRLLLRGRQSTEFGKCRKGCCLIAAHDQHGVIGGELRIVDVDFAQPIPRLHGLFEIAENLVGPTELPPCLSATGVLLEGTLINIHRIGGTTLTTLLLNRTPLLDQLEGNGSSLFGNSRRFWFRQHWLSICVKGDFYLGRRGCGNGLRHGCRTGKKSNQWQRQSQTHKHGNMDR